MKIIWSVVFLVCSVAAEAPYAPSGWRPDGPAFDLPQRQPERQYLPAGLDPRSNDPDLSVQGLPAQEQVPQFQVSPVSGLQYLGPSFLADLRNLDESLRRLQFRTQKNNFQQISNQRQQYEAPSSFRSSSNPSSQFASTTPITFTTSTPEQKNNNSTAHESDTKDKTTVEVTKLNVNEIPPELLLTPLAQLQLQSQQKDQLRAAIVIQPNNQINQKLVNPFNGGQFATIQAFAPQSQTPNLVPLIINQRQSLPSGVIIVPNGQPVFGENEETVDINFQNRGQKATPKVEAADPKADDDDEDENEDYQKQNYQPQFNQPQSYQPQIYQPQVQPQTYQPLNPQQQYVHPQNLQPPQYQPTLLQPNQPQYQQPSYQQYQPQFAQINNDDLYQYYQTQQQILQQQQLLQQQILQQQINAQSAQQGFQTGSDVNMQGNDDKKNKEDDDGSVTATAVAVAFDNRPGNEYGSPDYANRSINQQDPRPDETSTPRATEEDTTEKANRRKIAKLRSRRIRPVFTVDQSGHLVLAANQGQ